MALLYEDDDEQDDTTLAAQGSAPTWRFDDDGGAPSPAWKFDDAGDDRQLIGGIAGPTWGGVKNFASTAMKPFDWLGEAMGAPKQAMDWASTQLTGTTPGKVLGGLASGQTLADVMGVGEQFKQSREAAMKEHPLLGGLAKGAGERVPEMVTDPLNVALPGIGALGAAARPVMLGMQALMAKGLTQQAAEAWKEFQANGMTARLGELLGGAGVDIAQLGIAHALTPKATPRASKNVMEAPPLEGAGGLEHLVPEAPHTVAAKGMFETYLSEAKELIGGQWGKVAEGAIRSRFDPEGRPIGDETIVGQMQNRREVPGGGEGVMGEVVFDPHRLALWVEKQNVPEASKSMLFNDMTRKVAEHELSHGAVEASHTQASSEAIAEVAAKGQLDPTYKTDQVFDEIFARNEEFFRQQPNSPLYEAATSPGGRDRLDSIYRGLLGEAYERSAPAESGKLQAGRESMSISDLPPQLQEKPAPPPQRWYQEDLGELINTPRAAITAFDLSGLRQAAPAAARHPVHAVKALIEGAKALGSDRVYNELDAGLRADPNYQRNVDLGVFQAELGTKLNSEQIYFGNRLLNNAFKAMGLEKWNPYKASERGFNLMLNKLRMDVFNDRVRQLEGIGLDGSTKVGAAVLKNEANWVNNLTGRGQLPQGEGSLSTALRSAEPLLNAVWFSPRMIASRLKIMQKPVEWVGDFKRFQEAGLDAGQAAKAVVTGSAMDIGALLAYTAGTLALLKANGANVQDDPRSSDFGKVRVGNTRVDLSQGFGTYLKAAAQMLTGERITRYGKTQKIGRAEPLVQLARGKLAPVPGAIATFLTGREITGQAFDPVTTALSLIVPMSVNDIRKVYAEDPFLGTALLLPILTGAAGVQTHTPPSEFASKGAQEEFYKQGVTPPGAPRKSTQIGRDPLGNAINYDLSAEDVAGVRAETEPQMWKSIDDVIASPQYQKLSPKLQSIMLEGLTKQLRSSQNRYTKSKVQGPQAQQLMMQSYEDFNSPE